MTHALTDVSDLILPAKQPRSRARQTRIIQAGLDLLNSQSFDEMTMEQLARHADCSVGTLYKRFQNKDALLRVLSEAAVGEVLVALETDLTKAVTKTDSLSAAMRDVVAFLVGFFRQREALIRAIYHRQYNDPVAMEGLKAARSTFVEAALSKTLALRPTDMTAKEFARKFPIAVQVIVGALSNAVQNRPGPLMLEDDAIIDEFTNILMSYLDHRC